MVLSRHATGLISVAVALSAGSVAIQSQTSAISAAELRSMVTGLGYEVKDLSTEEGKEKFEFSVKTESLNIPLGAEISASKSFVWLTANLGEGGAKKNHLAYLKATGSIQPSMFYITSKDLLMIGLPIDNRGITPALLKARIEKITQDIESTSELWMDGDSSGARLPAK
ncbi:hypothetical protein QPK87_13440 [Kamptonema cortianum]|nr:hypothetical protein [Geitlerinema splendidum]MDK3157570.1 hypothetical protein [Kamptonema cortianum]